MTAKGVFALERVKKNTNYPGVSPETTLICIAQKTHFVGLLNCSGISCIIATANLRAVPDRCIRSAEERVGHECIVGQEKFQILQSDGLVSFFGISVSNFQQTGGDQKFPWFASARETKSYSLFFYATLRFEMSGMGRPDHFTHLCH